MQIATSDQIKTRKKRTKQSGESDMDKHIGQRLRQARTLSGMSQERLGEAVGVSFQQIQKYEKGLNRMGGSRIKQFSQILNVTPAYFFDGLLDGASNEADHVETNRGCVALLRSYNRIKSPLTRQRVLGLVQAIAGDAEADSSLEAAE